MARAIDRYWDDLTDTGGPSRPYLGDYVSDEERQRRIREITAEYHRKLGDYMGADLKWCKKKRCKHLSYCDSTLCCVYILHTEKQRPCPAGEGCTAFEK